VRFYSGKTGEVLRQIDLPKVPTHWAKHGCHFRWIDGGKDVNGDGIGDLLTRGVLTYPHPDRYHYNLSGNVAVYSGRTGTMLWRVYPGWDGALLGDLDGDGLSEWAHGNVLFSKEALFAGRVAVYKGYPGDAERVCVAKPNSTGKTARLLLEGPISVGNNDLHLVIEGGVPGQVANFFYGSELVSLPFGDGTLCAGGGQLGLMRIGAPVVLDAKGFAALKVNMTKGPMGQGASAWLRGTTWTLQARYGDPGGAQGFNLTDAMRVTFVP